MTTDTTGPATALTDRDRRRELYGETAERPDVTGDLFGRILAELDRADRLRAGMKELAR